MRRDQKYTDTMPIAEFVSLFTDREALADWFSDRELGQFAFPKNARSLAARYLVKKRVRDHLGADIRGNEMEILNDTLGKPLMIFTESMQKRVQEKGIEEILCSLSHSRNFAAGMTAVRFRISDC